MREIPDNLIDVQPEFAAALGLSVDEVKALSLRELSDRAFERGLELGVSTARSLTGEGHLKMVVDVGKGEEILGVLPHF